MKTIKTMIELSEHTKLEELVKYLPSENQDRIIAKHYEGIGLIASAFSSGGMIAGFWTDCVNGEIVRYLRRNYPKQKANTTISIRDGYCNCMDDFYIDDRCGKAPRKELSKLANELILLINNDYKPCAICGIATNKMIYQQHEKKLEEMQSKEYKEKHKGSSLWHLSDRKIKNRNLKVMDYICYLCYQNKLITFQKKRK